MSTIGTVGTVGSVDTVGTVTKPTIYTCAIMHKLLYAIQGVKK